MRNVAITLKYATNEEGSYLPQVFDKSGMQLSPSSRLQMRNVAISLKSSTNEERIYHPQVFDK